MALKLRPIDVVENITKEEFEEKYQNQEYLLFKRKCQKTIS